MAVTRARALLLFVPLVCVLIACSGGSDSGSNGDPAGTGSPAGPFARVATFCDRAAVITTPAAPDARVVAALLALGRPVATPSGLAVCDHDGYDGDSRVASAVAGAIASGSTTDRDSAAQVIESRTVEITTNPAVCVDRPRLPCSTEAAWLNGQAGALGAEPAAGAAEGAMGDALGDEAQAGDPTAADLLDGAATAQQLGLDDLADSLLDRAKTRAENEVLRLIGATDPCAGNADDLAAMLEAVAQVQALGGSGEIESRGMTHATRTVQGMGRNAAIGTGSESAASAAAEALGVEDGDDPRCRDEWQVHVVYETNANLGGGASLNTLWDGTVRLEIEPGGGAAATAPAVLDINSTNVTVAGCTTTWDIAPVDLTVNATESGDAAELTLDFAFGTSTISQTTSCPAARTSISSPPSAAPGPTDTVTLPAQDGATHSAPFSMPLPGGGSSSGALTVELQKIARAP